MRIKDGPTPQMGQLRINNLAWKERNESANDCKMTR